MRPPRCSNQEDTYLSRIFQVADNLRASNATFFQRKVTKTMIITEAMNGPCAYLEFPSKFVEAHEDFPLRCTFQSPNFERTWPISITVHEWNNAEKKKRLVAFAWGGWEDFVMDNNIEVGDHLFFSLLEISRYEARFEVHIVKKPSEQAMNVHPQSNNPLPQPNALEQCISCGLAMPPRFSAAVQNQSLEVPGRFWERHREMLQSDEVYLKGPRSKNIMVVEAKRTYVCDEEVVLIVRLDSGWSEFVVANRLQVGQSIEFALVGPSQFEVNL